MGQFSIGLDQYKSIASKLDRRTTTELDLIIGLFFMRIKIDPMFRGLFSRGNGVTWDVFGMIIQEKILRKDVKFYSLRQTIYRISSGF